ncbi:hypothetical protein V5799_032376 [Amblyomma americanum]|uniref:Uncharacterized protein n=1 Tax=Amblyomma americanum TaxID=6943 RepID=A0AAQ4DRC7_AMBAM
MYDTSSHTLMQLTKRLAKKTYTRLLRKVQQEDELEKIFRTWQLWIFRGLPFYHMVRMGSGYIGCCSEGALLAGGLLTC